MKEITRKGIWEIWVAVAVVVCLACVESASATIISVEVTGVVNSVWTDGSLALDGSVSVGSVMTGFYTYDTDTPDQSSYDWEGIYPLISISMTTGNYTFSHDLTVPELPCFYVQALANFHHIARSPAPRFDGIVYIDGLPRTYDEINFDPLKFSLIYLEAWNDYNITDALPDSFMDLSVYSTRSFTVGSYNDHSGPGFNISGELTSITVIPEPATLFLLGLGGLALIKKRKVSNGARKKS